MNEKLIKLVRFEGYCCLWSFLEVHRTTKTKELVKLAKEAGFDLTARAVRHQRRAYRRGLTVCKGATTCLKAKISEARKTP